jgi:hypothetical protein
MRNSRAKTAFIVAQSILGLVRRNNGGTFATLTFADNLEDLAEAKRRWHNLVRRMGRRLGERFELVGVWERQRRGAWHLHCVWSSWVDVNWLRPEAIECGFGPQLSLSPIKCPRGFTRYTSRPEKVSNVMRYLTKYLLKTVDEADSGKGVVTYKERLVKRGTTAFTWAGWRGILAGRGRQFLEDLARENTEHARVFGWHSGRFHQTPWEVCFRIGVNLLTAAERAAMALRFDGFARWLAGPPGAGNDLEPF